MQKSVVRLTDSYALKAIRVGRMDKAARGPVAGRKPRDKK